MSKIIEIKSCNTCPEFTSSRHYTADSFEMCFEFRCLKMKRKIGIFDWNEEPESIPTWCPLQDIVQ